MKRFTIAVLLLLASTSLQEVSAQVVYYRVPARGPLARVVLQPVPAHHLCAGHCTASACYMGGAYYQPLRYRTVYRPVYVRPLPQRAYVHGHRRHGRR